MFGKRRTAGDRDVATSASADLSGAVEENGTPGGGPWDASEAFTAMERVDLGSIQVPVLPGLDIQLVFAEQHGAWVTVRLEASEMQLQAFAAPKSSGIWDDVRAEIATEISGTGGVSEEHEGALGTELLARVPNEPGKPESGLRQVRFAGVDGRRWFLRALFTGPAAGDPAAAAPLEALMREVVVVRGDSPMPPRDLLELRLPADAAQALEEQARAAQEQEQQGGEGGRFNTPPTNPFERGPEMTETR